ncbi:MAG: aminoacyl-tRNA hydrolase [Alphaproteobacteria bacterium]
MLLFVGLGNPGPEHRFQRHNVGFMAVDVIAKRYEFAPFRPRYRGQLAEGRIGTTKVLALKPLTYMNDSGVSVGEAARFHKIPPEKVFVFHDELDLAPGKIRVKLGGSSAGHNGLRSIDAHLGPDYWRVRIGIGHPGDRSRVLSWVLRDFSKADGEWLPAALDAMAEAAPLLASSRDADFMSRVALLTRPQRPKPERRATDAATEN